MHPFFIYLIQANIALSVFFILYTVMLKRDTFLQLRRLFFLSVILFSLLYPFLTLHSLTLIRDLFPPASPETEVSVLVGELEMGTVVDDPGETPRAMPWNVLLPMVYGVVTFLFILRFLSQLISIFRLRKKSSIQWISGIPVYQLDDDITPFSFFHLIFIYTQKHTDTELNQILLHEQTHAREMHSLDILLMEWLCVVSWWNPFTWLMKREMAMNLEYLADNGVLTRGVNSREYQYHLLRLTYHKTAVPIVNNFNVSQLKLRIMMMNQSKSPANRLWRYLLILPLALLFVTANSIYAAQREPVKADTPMLDPAVVETTQKQLQLSTDNANLPEQVQAALHEQGLQQPPPEKKKEEIFVVVENQPEFPGGNEAMMKFISDSIRYPAIAKEKGIQGRVICNFVVMKDGSISDVQIVRGVDPVLDAEAVRVLESMPDWKPGKQRGQTVNVRFTLPVVFRLTGNESKVIIDELRTNEEDLLVQASVSSNFIFPGEENGLFKFISDRIKYPVEAQKNEAKGLVNASFRVDNAGNITDVKIESGENAILNKEVLRVIKEMPQWVKDKTYLVSGRVTDSDLQPLQGTSILLKGTNMGTITDASGNFQIKVPGKEGSLIFSFIGYKTTEVSLSNIKTGNGAIEKKLAVVFRLQGGDTTEPYSGPTPDNAIVVVGYGSKKLPEVNDPR